MPSSADLLDLERRFWLEASPDVYTDAMAAEGVMVFAPVGILDKEQTIAAVEGAGAWSEVEIEDVRTIELTSDSAALVYRVHAVREGQAPYDALATSVYVRRDGGWQIAVHQQTPSTDSIAGVATPLLIDCDPGHDDAIALLLALASLEVEVLGVTTVHGNQTLEKTTANALRVLELVGRDDVEVAAGADRPLERELVVAAHVHGESGLDGPALPPAKGSAVEQHAADFLAERIAPGTVLVATGPLTNVALLLERHRDAAAELDELVLMGGAIAEGNMTPAAEFNIWADPEAAAAVFGSGLQVTMIGLDVTHRALTTTDQAEELRAKGRVGAFVADLVEFFKRYHEETYGWDGAPIHDAVAVAEVIQPGLVTTKLRNVEIETVSELCRGRTVVDIWRRTQREPNARVGVGIDAEGFFRLLEERIAILG